MSAPSHSKIINTVARQILKPIGVKRKGQSRIWLDDNGWWITVVEFQPSAWSKGTYLNVGVDFQWYAKEHFSFDIDHREAGLISYESDEQFQSQVHEIAELARAKVQEIREQLSAQKLIKDYVTSSFQNHGPTLWGEFHQGMACIVSRENHEAIVHFKQILADPYEAEWAIELKHFTSTFVALIESGADPLKYIDDTVNRSRKLKKLEPTELRLAEIA